jgi:hypothetical protein
MHHNTTEYHCKLELPNFNIQISRFGFMNEKPKSIQFNSQTIIRVLNILHAVVMDRYGNKEFTKI